MLNVLKDILVNIKENGLSSTNQLYITFLTNHKNVKIPNWLLNKYPQEMTIILQYEYYDLKINKESFEVSLSFNDVEASLEIGYDSIISFADPSANFGLKLKTISSKKIIKKESKGEKDNIINLSNFKKN
jgi:Uncharacterized protein conserved in bacteria